MRNSKSPNNRKRTRDYSDIYDDVVNTDQYLEQDILKEFDGAIRDWKNLQV